MNNLISFNNVTKTYKRGSEEVHALSDLTFSISKGEYIALMGPSGSGKTTLLNIMGCMDLPTNGQIHINGFETSAAPEKKLIEIRRSTFGFVFQQFFLIPTLTVVQNVKLPTLFSRLSVDAKATNDLLEFMGLSKRLYHTPRQLSGGEMQRVAIARSLINSPQILIADEPTGNLDSSNSERIMDLFESLNSKGLTIIVATHNHELVKRCSRVIHLEDGIIKN